MSFVEVAPADRVRRRCRLSRCSTSIDEVGDADGDHVPPAVRYVTDPVRVPRGRPRSTSARPMDGVPDADERGAGPRIGWPPDGHGL